MRARGSAGGWPGVEGGHRGHGSSEPAWSSTWHRSSRKSEFSRAQSAGPGEEGSAGRESVLPRRRRRSARPQGGQDSRAAAERHGKVRQRLPGPGPNKKASMPSKHPVLWPRISLFPTLVLGPSSHSWLHSFIWEVPSPVQTCSGPRHPACAPPPQHRRLCPLDAATPCCSGETRWLCLTPRSTRSADPETHRPRTAAPRLVSMSEANRSTSHPPSLGRGMPGLG